MTRIARDLFFGLVLVTLGVPLVVVAGVSVNAKKVLFFPPRGFSLGWFEEVFANPAWFDALIASLSIALLSGLLAVSIALPLAYAVWRHGFRYARALYALGLLPFALPPVITALGMLIFWAAVGWVGRVENIVVGHGVFLVTLPMVMISLGLESIDRQILEAAETMGADRAKAFWTIVLPLITPYLVAGFAFVFVLSMNEFIIAFFLGQFATVTLPVKIFSSLRSGYTPVIASVSVMFMALAVLVFSLVARFGDLPKLLGAWNPDRG
jgi:putative spermidine/putrescine transport system permease protein